MSSNSNITANTRTAYNNSVSTTSSVRRICGTFKPQIYFFFPDEIAVIQKDVEEYRPETRRYLINQGKYEWIERAVSKKAREEWLNQWAKKPAQLQNFNQALDAVSAAAARKIPERGETIILQYSVMESWFK